jgi:hypothetical protein
MRLGSGAEALDPGGFDHVFFEPIDCVAYARDDR